MKKQIMYLFCSLIIILGLSGCTESNNANSQVTRGEWITMLSDAFALDTYNIDLPYYSDVMSSDEIFPFVQSASEWGILSVFENGELKPHLPVTRDEVASTAAIASGFRPNEAGEFDIARSIDYAVEHGIIDQTGKGTLKAEECDSILEAAQDIYLTNPGEDKITVEYSDDLVDLREFSDQLTVIEEDKISLPASLTGADSAVVQMNGQEIQLSIGDTFLSPATEESPMGNAYKIVALQEESGQVIFSLAAPSFGDIYDSADIHTTLSLSDNSIIWSEGVETSRNSMKTSSAESYGYHIQPLSSENSSSHRPDTDSFSFDWHKEFNTGAVKIYQDALSGSLGNTPGAQALEASNFIYTSTPSIADFNGTLQSWTKELEKLDKYEGGHSVTIDLSLQLSALVDISYDKPDTITEESDLWPQSVSVVLHSDIMTDFALEGDIGEEKKFKIGEVLPIPIGQTGLTLGGSLFVYVEATGKLEIRLEAENTQRVGWNIEEERQGYQPSVRRRTGQWGNESSAKLEGSVDLSAGPGLEVELTAFSTVKLIGMDCKVGGDWETTGTLTGNCTEQTASGVTTRHYTETLCLNSTSYLPIVTLTVSGPEKLADILGAEKSWDIVKKEDAKQTSYTIGEWIIWEQTVQIDDNGEIVSDFSPYVGTYAPYDLTENETASVLELREDGSINGESGYSGGGVTFSDPLAGNDIKPISIITCESGAIECTLVDEGFYDLNNDESARMGRRVRYIIYPPGIIQNEDGEYEAWLDETKNTVRIRYLAEDNGVLDIRYCQVANNDNTFDLSSYAGTYTPYAKGYGVVSNLNYSDLIMMEDGSLQGEYTYFLEDSNTYRTNAIQGSLTPPNSVNYEEDGTIRVELVSKGDYIVEYLIVPPYVDISSYISTGVDPYAHSDQTRIVYVEGYLGSTVDIYYYKA